jgi:replicative DNA helicase
MATKHPDENDRARGIGPPLPADPFADTVLMLDPDAEAAAKAKADAEAKLEAEREAAKAALLDCRVGSFMDAALERMERRHAGTERPIPLPWASMTEALGGGLWSGMYVLVGNTGSGKSQLSLQIAVEAARARTPVLYIGLELGRMDLTARLIGLLTPVPWSYLYLGKSVQTPSLRTKYAAELEELRRLPFHLELGGPFGWSYADLEPRVRVMRDLYPEPDGPGSRPMLVVLDFLQLVSSPEGEREELRERIGRAAYVGRKVARDYDAAVVLVSSTSRDNYSKLDAAVPGKDGKAADDPPLAALVGLGKESGEVEYAADAVLALRRQAWVGTTPPSDGSTVRVAVAKGRAVTPSSIELRFNGTRFSEPNTKPTGTVKL